MESRRSTNLAKKNLRAIADLLKKKFNDFDHYNKKNPLNELLFILCSVKTTQNNYLKAYKSLRGSLRTFEMIGGASLEEIARLIKCGGLSNQRAKAIKEIAAETISRFGKFTLSPLKRMTDQECEFFLISLPMVGKKVARCVMMYSLNRKVFPVDTHCWRICRRLGLVRKKGGTPPCSEKDMDRLQQIIPPELRRTLHVNMVSLGRKFCTHANPTCEACPIQKFCKKAGLKAGSFSKRP